MRLLTVIVSSAFLLIACTPAPPLEHSRNILWQRYGHHSIDDVLLDWGTPAQETKLTNGARLVAYNRTFTYDAASPYENTAGCEVTYLAPKPDFTIENIAIRGDPSECAVLAKNGPGYGHSVYVPPPGFYPGYPAYR